MRFYTSYFVPSRKVSFEVKNEKKKMHLVKLGYSVEVPFSQYIVGELHYLENARIFW